MNSLAQENKNIKFRYFCRTKDGLEELREIAAEDAGRMREDARKMREDKRRMREDAKMLRINGVVVTIQEGKSA